MEWRPQAFYLWRDEDESGVSGTGRVATGVLFPITGHCIMEWIVEPHTMGIYDSVDDLIKVHGHNGKTRLVWVEEVR